MARTTPAQKPRGEQSKTLRTGLGELDSMFRPRKRANLARISGMDMGCPAPACQACRLHDPGAAPIFHLLFPIIIDDPKLRPGAGGAYKRFFHGDRRTPYSLG